MSQNSGKCWLSKARSLTEVSENLPAMITLTFWLLAVLIVLLLLKIPIALAMTLASMVFLYLMAQAPMIIVPQRLWGGLRASLCLPFLFCFSR